VNNGNSGTRLGTALVAMVLLLPATTAAETAYVIDRLLLGVHESRELNSAIIKVLPTATALEILERDGDFARIRTPDGVTGWTDASYLMSEKPAQLLVAELDARRQELDGALADARAQLETFKAGNGAGPDLPPVASDALRDLQRLAEENRALNEQLSALTAANPDTLSVPGKTETTTHTATTPVAALTGWQWLLLVSLLLLAFSTGAYAVDYSGRMRHGGFRI
jgi:SH3 domain protein